jgi:hypothetical protein
LHLIDFEKLCLYDAAENGITVQTTLKLSNQSVSFPAKIDTGSTFCIFERRYGAELGLEIEQGLFQRI